MTTSTTTTVGGTEPGVHTDGRVRLVEFKDRLRVPLAYAAMTDHHQIIAPTHVVLKGEEVIGYGSLGAVPMMFAWMHSRRATPRDSFTAWRLAEAAMRQRGIPAVCMPCEASSPFAPHLARQGYEILGTAQITMKLLKG